MPPKSQSTDPKKSLPVIKDDYGNIVNPYIPRFIVKTPWYVAPKDGEGADVHQSPLEHQRAHVDDGPKTEILDPVKTIAPAAKKFRKGACENCGAISHRTEDCVERPRAKGAKVTGEVTGTEVSFKEADHSFVAKRDRWRGYDPEEYLEVLETRKADLEKKESSDSDSDNTSDSDEDNGIDTNSKQLRIREDTAKYLKDIRNESSSTYDPKTRSMRDVNDANDGFVPANPQALKEQVFAWQEDREPGKPRNESDQKALESSGVAAKSEEELRRLGVDKASVKTPNDHRYNY